MRKIVHSTLVAGLSISAALFIVGLILSTFLYTLGLLIIEIGIYFLIMTPIISLVIISLILKKEDPRFTIMIALIILSIVISALTTYVLS